MFAAAEDVPGAAVDPTAVDLLSWTAKIGYWTARTIGIAVHYTYYYASFVLFSILKLIYEPLSFILAPVFYLAQFTSNGFLAPFRFLAKFETLYIYLAIAALIGLAGGLTASFIYSLLRTPLGLDINPQPAGRTAKQYRKTKSKQKARTHSPLSLSLASPKMSSDPYSLSDGLRTGHRKKGLLAQTIMEEADSDY